MPPWFHSRVKSTIVYSFFRRSQLVVGAKCSCLLLHQKMCANQFPTSIASLISIQKGPTRRNICTHVLAEMGEVGEEVVIWLCSRIQQCKNLPKILLNFTKFMKYYAYRGSFFRSGLEGKIEDKLWDCKMTVQPQLPTNPTVLAVPNMVPLGRV